MLPLAPPIPIINIIGKAGEIGAMSLFILLPCKRVAISILYSPTGESESFFQLLRLLASFPDSLHLMKDFSVCSIG